MSDERTGLWGSLDSGLRNVIEDLGSKIGSGDAAMILRFADHNEFGVAFVTLRDLLIEEQTPVPAAMRTTLVELARLMEIDSREAELRPAHV